jgi:hypothetical protein
MSVAVWVARVCVAGLRLYSFADMERLGFRYPHPQHPPEPEDVATFSYTSGTTGGPKVRHREERVDAVASTQLICLARESLDRQAGVGSCMTVTSLWLGGLEAETQVCKADKASMWGVCVFVSGRADQPPQHDLCLRLGQDPRSGAGTPPTHRHTMLATSTMFSG